MIRVFNVSKRYGRRLWALKEVSLRVEKGQSVLLRGDSGAGKTTLLRLIFAADKPDHGQIVVAGRNISKLQDSSLPYLRRQMGVVFQDLKLLNSRTVLENVMLPLQIRGWWGRRARKRAERVCAELGLAGSLNRRCGELAGGEQQLTSVARAVVTRPEIILADEPTSYLDTRKAFKVVQVLERLAAAGTTLILATSDLVATGALKADRVVELRSGRLVADVGTAAEATAKANAGATATDEPAPMDVPGGSELEEKPEAACRL